MTPSIGWESADTSAETSPGKWPRSVLSFREATTNSVAASADVFRKLRPSSAGSPAASAPVLRHLIKIGRAPPGLDPAALN